MGNKENQSSRREFVRNSLGALAAFTIVPRHVLGRGYLAPSDQLTKAVVGTGGMGRGHFNYAGTRVVAVCDVDKTHIQKALDVLPNGGKGVKTFADYRELIQLPEVDI